MSVDLPWENKEIHVAVIGDFILDEYLDGSVTRISPEAPVPIHLVKSRSVTAGGAGNAGRNIQLVGAQVSLFGALGCDDAGATLVSILEADGINTHNLLRSPLIRTIKKTRLTSHQQQMVRIDWEQNEPWPAELTEELYRVIQVASFDILLISDYGKGCLTPHFLQKLLLLSQHSDKGPFKIVIDPKGTSYEKYRHAHLVTPNREEACQALNLDPSQDWDPKILAAGIRDQFGIHNVLVTLGDKGMVGLKADTPMNAAFELPAQAREVFDVSGAGDTVVSLMTLAIACDLPLEQAMNLANCGAGVVVEKRGTQPITKDQLKKALGKKDTNNQIAPNKSIRVRVNQKILNRSLISQTFSPKNLRQQRIVFTNGCFDLIHAGHVAYLEAAAELGDILIVAINSDASVTNLKGPGRPIMPLQQRMEMLAGLSAVDYVVSFSESTPVSLIEEIDPDILVKGADYKVEEVVGSAQVLKRGGLVKTLAFVEGVSTTELINRIRACPEIS